MPTIQWHQYIRVKVQIYPDRWYRGLTGAYKRYGSGMEGDGITEMSYVLLEFHTSTVRRHCATTPVAPTSAVPLSLCPYVTMPNVIKLNRQADGPLILVSGYVVTVCWNVLNFRHSYDISSYGTYWILEDKHRFIFIWSRSKWRQAGTFLEECWLWWPIYLRWHHHWNLKLWWQTSIV